MYQNQINSDISKFKALKVEQEFMLFKFEFNNHRIKTLHETTFEMAAFS